MVEWEQETDGDALSSVKFLELFLPSYTNEYGESSDLEHRPDPVEEIVLTDEEAAAILPV